MKTKKLLLGILFIITFALLIDLINYNLLKELPQKRNDVTIVFKDITNEPLDRRSFEYGKGVGRNAMLQYISTYTEFDDTLRIEILDLMALEDTLSKKYKFK